MPHRTRKNPGTILLACLIVGTVLAASGPAKAQASPLELATVEAWLVSSQEWIDRAWRAATEVRTAYRRSAAPANEPFDGSLVPLATRREIHDLLDGIPRLLEEWQVLSGNLIVQASLDPTDPDLGHLDQLLKAQLATMNALGSMLSEVLPGNLVDRTHFELTGDVAKLWQAISAMLIRQLQDNDVPIFREPL